MPLFRIRPLLPPLITTVGLAAAVLVGPSPTATAGSGTFTQPAPIHVEHDNNGFLSERHRQPFAIPDGGATSSGHATSDLLLEAKPEAVVSRIDITVAITHTHLDDVDLVLEAPDGRTVTLASDIGGATNGATSLTFDQGAPPFPDEGAIGGGASSAVGAPADYDTAVDLDDGPGSAPASLRDLGGAPVAGAWTLHAFDDTAGGLGSVDRWTLFVAYGFPATPNPSTLPVSGLPPSVTDVDLVLNDVDGSLGDTEFLLESPDGRYAHVLSDVAVEDITSHVDLTLDDQAVQDVSSFAAPISGNTYRPANYDGMDQSEVVGGVDTLDLPAALSVFDGGPANGTWKLWVHGEFCCASVTVGSWALRITAEDPPALAPAPPAPAGPPSPTLNDTTAPLLDDVELTPRRLPTGVGARLRVTSAEAATLVGRVQRKNDCRWRHVGTKQWSLQAGANTRLFYGKTAQGRLRSGHYRVLLMATDAAGNTSSEVSRPFSVDRR